MNCICCDSNQIIPQPISSEEYFKCLFCGLTFSLNRTDNNFRTRVASYYQNVDPHERVASSKQSFFKSSLEYLASEIKGKQKSILDVGCGHGYFLELALRNGWNTFGVEIVDEAVRDARKRLGESKIFHGSFKDALYPDEFFDAVTAWDVLFIVDNPFLELKECHRILKQGGKIGIRVRNVSFQKLVYRLYLPLKRIASRLGVRNPYVFHPYCFTRKSLYFLLHRTGFRHIKILNSPLTKGDPYSHAKMRRLTSSTKALVELSARVISALTRGRCIVGPSLIVWAEKPHSSIFGLQEG